MSAITGICQLKGRPVHLEQCTHLMTALNTYPFDDRHTWSCNHIFMGCHHQWITPQSIGERLPFYDSEQQLAITADAMIDNRRELFERLQIDQMNRQTITDSELILLAYIKWGKDCPKHLIGDFAFIIWDERKQALFGARDFSGARTLYYYKDHDRFAFCTILEPLLKLPFIKKEINEVWLAEFLAIPTIIESADVHHTVYRRINQLPPGHTVIIQNGEVKLERYWYVGHVEPLKLKSDEEYAEAFHEIFKLAVSEKMRTHGEVGAHLSGGLDSGSVVSFAAKELQHMNKSLYTYSYIPEDTFEDWTPSYYTADERPFIRETVRYVGNIKDQYLDFAEEDPFSTIDDFLDIMEMPYKFFENAFWLNGINKKAQKDGVKVLLSGARGNHSISWGSERLNMEYYASLLKQLRLLKLNRELNFYCQNFLTGKRHLLPIVAKRGFPNLFRLLTMENGPNHHFPPIINQEFAKKTNVYDRLKEFGIDLDGQVQGSLKEYRRNYYDQLHAWNKSGTATTKLSLRYSLWDRDPTNDPRVIRFCLSIPEEQYVCRGMERSFIRRVTKNVLPEKVRLNLFTRGIQAADTIHRMRAVWPQFRHEMERVCKDSAMEYILDMDVVKNALEMIHDRPSADFVWSNEFKILTRSLIVYRFLQHSSRKEVDQ